MIIAICGYGNLGRGVELAVRAAPDAGLFGIFTRRAPDTVITLTGVDVFPVSDILKYKNDIDILIICGGSATDLPRMTPELAAHFNVVDSFDTHARVPAHFETVNSASSKNSHIALISAGWDPGMFSLARLYASAILPDGVDYTFWGRGVSQGHSDAVRRLDGVVDALQYTVPEYEALDAVRRGDTPAISPCKAHRRECYVVAAEGADRARIEHEIKTMPDYFAGYETTVDFITKEVLLRDHAGLPHGGTVIRTGKTGESGEHSHVIEYSLKLGSNPEFTASVLVAFARALYRMYLRGERGCKTVFDVRPADLLPLSAEGLRERLL